MKLIKKITSICVMAALVLCIAAVPSVKAEAATDSGTFTAAAMNVDGLPAKLIVDVNPDGPGTEGTKKISNKVAEKDWDFFAVSEDFNFHAELMSGLTGYTAGTHRGKVNGLSNNTDGLNLIWKNTLKASGEKWIKWNTYNGTLDNGNDGLINKGYRFYQMTVAENVVIDVYILHMDAGGSQGDIDARESQLTQLSDAIKASNNKNPIIVMGDTNCRYTRENLKTGFIDVIDADSRFTIQDCWIETCKGGAYPAYGSASLMVGDLGYEQGEIVDKMFFINNTDSNIELTLNSFKVDLDFNDADGTPLGDHYPVVGEFTYTVKTPIVGTTPTPHTHSYTEAVTKEPTCTEAGVKTYTCECGDSYTEAIPMISHSHTGAVTKEPTCTEAGVKTYTCVCGDSYTEALPMIAHNYVDGKCTACGQVDPDYVEPAKPVNPAKQYVLGREVAWNEIVSGKQYAIYFHSTSCKYSLTQNAGEVDTEKTYVKPGDTISPETVWTLSEKSNGWTISQNVDGKELYLANSNVFYGVGYKMNLSETPLEWMMQANGKYDGVRFSTVTLLNRKSYLRYYNARVGWAVTTNSAPVHVYEINE